VLSSSLGLRGLLHDVENNKKKKKRKKEKSEPKGGNEKEKKEKGVKGKGKRCGTTQQLVQLVEGG
jgi:hypothetical protein